MRAIRLRKGILPYGSSGATWAGKILAKTIGHLYLHCALPALDPELLLCAVVREGARGQEPRRVDLGELVSRERNSLCFIPLP